MAVLRDRESPESVRIKCGFEVRGCRTAAYTSVIYADPAIRDLRRTGPPKRWRRLNALLDSGEIRLGSKAAKQLEFQRSRIHEFREALIALRDDEHESAGLKKWSKAVLKGFDRLPLLKLDDAPFNQPPRRD